MTISYERNPARIYEDSFRMITSEADLTAVPAPQRDLAIRLIHACGMVDLVQDFRVAGDATGAGRDALSRGAPVLCDANMVAHGVIRRALPPGVNVCCTLDDPEVPELAHRLNTTRSAAAVELWADRIGGAVVAIGNAPTALFHLLDRLRGGWPAPAVILGFPVGFVGAAESKAALASGAGDIPYATVLGRRGGSAMAAAAVNALSLGLGGDGR